jgi:RND family efflux transporter MFP subunit
VEEAALKVAKHRSVMEGELRSAETRLGYSRDKLRRREELIQKGFISAQDRDDTYAEMRVAEAELTRSKENLELSALESKRLREVLEQRRLRSPFSGLVTDRLQHPGELAQTGEGARAILKLAQIQPLRVEVILPLDQYGTIRNGTHATVEPEPPLRGSYQATVRVVDKVVDSASGTFGVRLEIPNPKGEVISGVKCRVRFN